MIEVGERVGIFLLTLIYLGTYLIGGIACLLIAGFVIFHRSIHVIEGLYIVLVSVIESGTTHECIRVARVLLKEFVKGLHESL